MFRPNLEYCVIYSLASKTELRDITNLQKMFKKYTR